MPLCSRAMTRRPADAALRGLLLAAALTLLVALALGLCASARAQDQPAPADERAARLVAFSEEIPNAEEPRLVEIRGELRKMREAVQADLAPAQRDDEALRLEIDALGATPDDGQREDVETAARRDLLNQRIEEVQAKARVLVDAQAQIQRLLDQIAQRRRENFYGRIFELGDTPFSADLMTTAAGSLATVAQRTVGLVDQRLILLEQQGKLRRLSFTTAAAVLFALLFFLVARRRFKQRLDRAVAELAPTPGRRATIASLRLLASAAPAAAAAALVYAVSTALGAIPPQLEPMLSVLLAAGVGVIAVAGALRGLAPRTPAAWRIAPISGSAAFAFRMLGRLAAIVLAVDAVLTQAVSAVFGSQELALAQSALVACALAVLLMLLSRPSLWRLHREQADAATQHARSALWPLIGLLGLGVLIVVAVGYVSLGHYVATRAFYIAAALLAAYMLRGLGVGAAALLLAPAQPTPGHEDEGLIGDHFWPVWIGPLMSLVAGLTVAPFVFLILGAQWVDVRDAVMDIFFGFRVGETTVSLAAILGGLAVFLVVLAVTRSVQRGLERSIFPYTKMDAGVQSSFRTLIGYFGFLIAALLAIGVVGVDLSNIAIIAGALSVGIGFGLQSIVNNFVSGLILLFERPIKVGDWIVASSGEGYVKRISVRATEIQTFDRASVIVPNSELVSGAVTNWTHSDKLGRVKVAVGVSYDDDPREVIRLLEEVADENAQVLRDPRPVVYFAGFGDSSLDFELRVFLRDVNYGLGIRTELRLAVFEKFKAAGVSIPFPQRDLHVRMMDRDEPLAPERQDEAPAT